MGWCVQSWGLNSFLLKMVGQCCFGLGFLLFYSQTFNLTLEMVRSIRGLLSHLQGKVQGSLAQELNLQSHSSQDLNSAQVLTHDRAAHRSTRFELLQELMNSQGFDCSKKKFSRQKTLYLASLGLVEIKGGGKVVGFRALRLFVVLFLLLSLLIVLLGLVLTQRFLLILLGI